ncbi:uncharacterized protein LOC119689220 [Teleopsis dalmanni]|uniref:uncharacterized protein LOC119689220 n=1 Tax=Teleopsis dalmanni TaxID=139649 RepID=UPI0018CDD770|nr:uncharacterized protein LOC119689220 [Teleopsis dalmanni]
MFPQVFALIISTIIMLNMQQTFVAGAGYHYERPAASLPAGRTEHVFGPIPTIQPLPPIPALPPLPTARSKFPLQPQTLLFHTAQPTIAPRQSLGTLFIPPTAPATFTVTNAQQPQAFVGFIPPTASATFGSGVGVAAGAPPTAPPLRIPFGKQAVIHLPTADERDFYVVNGRQLKQYAVIEIIDNDIEQSVQPFLSGPTYDLNRARIGASGTGALSPLPSTQGLQIGSRSSALLVEQQRVEQPTQSVDDPITLGSGGLGYVRLPNGNVYLGSGSLGYISAQQRSRFVMDARTRTGANAPSPLHFGHGALGGTSNVFRFK